MQIRSNNNQKGFTLIELLVVISIIGFLSTTVLVALSRARVNARNTQRVSEFKKAREALSLYYQDNGFYPDTANVFRCFGPFVSGETCYGTPGQSTQVFVGDNNLVAALAPYISRMPKTYITSGLGRNYFSYQANKASSPKWLYVIWPYEGAMPDGLCPMFSPENFSSNSVTILTTSAEPNMTYCAEWYRY